MGHGLDDSVSNRSKEVGAKKKKKKKVLMESLYFVWFPFSPYKTNVSQNLRTPFTAIGQMWSLTNHRQGVGPTSHPLVRCDL